MEQKLTHLLTYTVFHIGVYISLVTAFIAAGVFTRLKQKILKFSVACFLVAVVCGAVIGSNIPEYANWSEFSSAKIGFWGLEIFTYKVWARLEHASFWVGIVPIALIFILRGSEGFVEQK